MKKNNMGFPIFSTNSGLVANNEHIKPEFDTKIDIDIKEPKLYDFGGDLSKRWYIDYYNNSKRLRKWIASKPLSTKESRAKAEFQKINLLYKAKNNNYATILQALEKMELKKKSKQTYKTDLKILIKVFPDFNHVDPKIFRDYLIDNKYHKNTIRNKITNIKAVLAYCHENNFISFNPFENFKSLSRVSDSDCYFPFSEHERNLIEPELIKHKELYLFTRFIFYSFSRVSELQRIQIKDIDIRTKTIKLRPENTKTEKLLIKPILKPLFDLIIDSGILSNPSNYYVFGHNLKPGFKSCQKNLPTTLHREILKKVGIYRNRETSIYAWKHTGNIQAYLAGMDLKIIQKINGHSNILTTEVYLRKLGLFLDKQAYDIIF